MAEIKNENKDDGDGKESVSSENRPVIDYDDVTVKGCFDFRVRTSSFDLHLLGQHKKSRFSHLFKSKSDTGMKSQPPGSVGSPASSPAPSPRIGSPQTVHRRRLVRVVRDNDRPGEEYENPNVIRRYTSNYWENCQQLAKKSSDEFGKSGSVDLPYVVSGHTILKKQHSRDDSGDHLAQAAASGKSAAAVTSLKHTCFRDEVQVIEFDRKNKVEECTVGVHAAQLLSAELCASAPDFSVPANSCENDVSEDRSSESSDAIDRSSNLTSSPTQEAAGASSAGAAASANAAKSEKKDVEEEDVKIVENRFTRLKTVDGPLVRSHKSLDAEFEALEDSPDWRKKQTSLPIKTDGLIVRSLKKLREELMFEGYSADRDHKKSSHHHYERKNSNRHIRFDLSNSNVDVREPTESDVDVANVATTPASDVPTDDAPTDDALEHGDAAGISKEEP